MASQYVTVVTGGDTKNTDDGDFELQYISPDLHNDDEKDNGRMTYEEITAANHSEEKDKSRMTYEEIGGMQEEGDTYYNKEGEEQTYDNNAIGLNMHDSNDDGDANNAGSSNGEYTTIAHGDTATLLYSGSTDRSHRAPTKTNEEYELSEMGGADEKSDDKNNSENRMCCCSRVCGITIILVVLISFVLAGVGVGVGIIRFHLQRIITEVQRY